MDAAVMAFAAIGRAVLPVIAPLELVTRVEALERGELAGADAMRTLHDLGLVAETAGRIR